MMQIKTSYRMITFKEFKEILSEAGYSTEFAENLTENDSIGWNDSLYDCPDKPEPSTILIQYLQTREWRIHCNQGVFGLGDTLKEAKDNHAANMNKVIRR